MPTTSNLKDSRVARGELHLEDCASTTGALVPFNCAPTSVAIKPGTTTGNSGTTLTALCGEDFPPEDATGDSNSATMDLTLVSDFLEQGLVAYSWKCAGEKKFEWIPNGDSAQVWKGTVEVTPIEVGGEVGKRLTPTVSWKITSLQLPALYGGKMWLGAKVTGITAPTAPSKIWTFTPSNAMPFADLAALKSDSLVGDAGSKKPARDFTTGEYVELAAVGGVSVKAHFKATGGWAPGAAV